MASSKKWKSGSKKVSSGKNIKAKASTSELPPQRPTPAYADSDSVYEGGSLLPPACRAKLPSYEDALNASNPQAHFRFFAPWGSTATDHYVLGGSPDTRKQSWYEDDFILLVYVNGEVGSASLRELESVRGFGGLRIERDRHFRECSLNTLRKAG